MEKKSRTELETANTNCHSRRTDGFIEPCLLLLLAVGESHGYELLQRLPEFGFQGDAADSVNMYRVLRKLESKGLLVSSWTNGQAGPSKRVYRITDVGKEALESWEEAISAKITRLTLFLKRLEDIRKNHVRG